MPQINITEPTVQHHLTPTDSVTVPSGEVWKVTITIQGQSEITFNVNGNGVYDHAFDSTNVLHTIETVFVGGDTITNTSQSDGNIYISGFDVSGTVDNNAVSESVAPSGSVTVPAGETWRVTVFVGGSGNEAESPIVSLNSTQLMETQNTATGGNKSTIVLTGGDTISMNANGGCHIGGFKV